MGGVGMLGGEELSLPYPWIMRNNITIKGQWMYPREANLQLIRMIQAGLVDLNQFELKEFSLAEVNSAIQHAAESGNAFMTTVLKPSW
jgi:alcohol dehydrogenase